VDGSLGLDGSLVNYIRYKKKITVKVLRTYTLWKIAVTIEVRKKEFALMYSTSELATQASWLPSFTKGNQPNISRTVQ
jgi:hypothetical protein